MESIEKHIEKDKKIVEDPLANPAARRHAKVELEELETYAEHHKKEIEAGDHHDPNALELFCDTQTNQSAWCMTTNVRQFSAKYQLRWERWIRMVDW